jgi:hypothetical protein
VATPIFIAKDYPQLEEGLSRYLTEQFKKIEQVLKTLNHEGTWTPIDDSGAGLVFPTASGYYVRVGRLVTVTARVVYPVTADGSTAFIGGLPFTVKDGVDAGTATGTLSYHTGATATKFVALDNTTTAALYTNAGVLVTNAQMSGTLSSVSATYIIEP